MYWVAMEGLSIDRMKIDLFDAYASLSPLESAESGVGCPLVVVGNAANMLSDHCQCWC